MPALSVGFHSRCGPGRASDSAGSPACASPPDRSPDGPAASPAPGEQPADEHVRPSRDDGAEHGEDEDVSGDAGGEPPVESGARGHAGQDQRELPRPTRVVAISAAGWAP